MSAASEAGSWSPEAFRARVAANHWRTATTGVCLGYVQANLTVLPREYAFDFLLFCTRNPLACPVLDVLEPGTFTSQTLAPGADLRTDLPRYRIYRDGEQAEEVEDILDRWPADGVAFLLGCSLTCDEALLDAGVPVRHLEDERRAPVYITDRPMTPAGPFAGPLAVNLRAVPGDLVSRAAAVTARFPSAHGAPVHVGDPADLGLEDLDRVHAGDPPVLRPGDVPMFWGCGVSAELAALHARCPLMITHAPGHMFVTDQPSGLSAIC